MSLAFAVLLYRAVYFRFRRGLIPIFLRSLGFYDCLRLLFLTNSAPSSREPFTRRIVRAFLAVSADLTRSRPTCAFTT